MIEVEQTRETDPYAFDVIVREGGGASRHQVTLSDALYQKLTDGQVSPRRCVRAAFEFLLDREPKESILSTFDVSVISRYFPDFENAFGRYMGGD